MEVCLWGMMSSAGLSAHNLERFDISRMRPPRYFFREADNSALHCHYDPRVDVHFNHGQAHYSLPAPLASAGGLIASDAVKLHRTRKL